MRQHKECPGFLIDGFPRENQQGMQFEQEVSVALWTDAWVGWGWVDRRKERWEGGRRWQQMPVVQCIFRIFLPYYSKLINACVNKGFWILCDLNSHQLEGKILSNKENKCKREGTCNISNWRKWTQTTGRNKTCWDNRDKFKCKIRNVSTIRGTFPTRTGILKERNLVTSCILRSFTVTALSWCQQYLECLKIWGQNNGF